MCDFEPHPLEDFHSATTSRDQQLCMEDDSLYKQDNTSLHAQKEKKKEMPKHYAYPPMFDSPFLIDAILLDQDVEDILNYLDLSDLNRLFGKLDITPEYTEEAIRQNLDPKEEVRLILRYWREINGHEATLQQILDALTACGLKYKALVLEEQSGARYEESETEDPVPQEMFLEVVEQHTRVFYDKSKSLVKKTLLESTNILCHHFETTDILRSMKSKGALTQDDVTEIKKQTTATEQVDKLIGVLIRKPVSAYNTMMYIVQEESPILHSEIKAIEENQSLKRKHDPEDEKISYRLFPGKHWPLIDQDIEYIVDLLKPNELERLLQELNMTPADKEEAIKVNLDPKEKARFILHYWREIHGRKATKQKILDALIACRLKYNMYQEIDHGVVFGAACYAGSGNEDSAPM